MPSTARPQFAPRSLLALFVRFVASGGAATGLHYAVMIVLIGSGVRAEYATAVGAMLGATGNYLLQYWMVFDGHRPHRQALPRYAVWAVVSWALNLAMFALLHRTLAAGVAIAQAGATLLTAFFGFWACKRMVFHE